MQLRPARSSIPWAVVLWALVLLVVGLPGASQAQDDKARAAALAESAVVLSRSGDYAEALALFEKAYALDPAPTLLYNIGRVAEKTGDLGKATKALEGYLAVETDPAMRGKAEDALRSIAERRAEAARTEPAPAAASPLARPEASAPAPIVVEGPGQRAANDLSGHAPVQRRGLSTTSWVLIGVGAAAIVGGGIAAAVLLARGGGPAAADDTWTLRGAP